MLKKVVSSITKIGAIEGMKRPCENCKELVDKIDRHRRDMGNALYDVIKICDERAGTFDPTVLRQIRARAHMCFNIISRTAE